MAAPVVEEAQGPGSPAVVVLHGERSHAACDALVGIGHRVGHRPGLRGVEVHHIDVGPHVPRLRNLIAQLGITAVLLESHVGAVPVGAVVRAADHRREPSLADAVRRFRLQCVIGAVADVGISLHALLAHPAGDDVHHAAHRVRTVEHRCRAAQHFDPFGHQRLVGIGDRVSHQPHVLRVPVDEHHQPPRASAQPAQGDASRGAVRHAVAHDPACGGEQPRNLLGQGRQQRRLQALFDLLPADHRHGHRQVADVRRIARPRHDDRVDLHVLLRRGFRLRRHGVYRE